MPMFFEMLRKLNREFDEDRIEAFAQRRAAFAPGARLDAGLLDEPHSARRAAFQAYLDKLPGATHETIRSTIYFALSTKPPTPVTFAWAPARDFEITLWQPTCGITALVKGPNPSELGIAEQPAV
jgi:hypothetical protein